MTAKQLTDSILQLAIQGKLVPQDPNDEPASILLDKIREEKRRLVKEKVLKMKDLEEIPVEDCDEPFNAPEGWIWVRLGSLCSVKGGKRIPVGENFSEVPTKHIYIRVTDMKNHSLSSKNLKYISDSLYERLKQYTISKNDLYLTIAGTIGDVGIVPEEFDGMNLTENAVKLSYLQADKYYLLYSILSPFIQVQFVDKTKQMAQPKLAIERIKTTMIPLPPLAEQRRIVQRIEEILPFVNEYGEAYEEASKMDAELPDKLKKSILQEAIMGKLGTQDPNDEPASKLLEQIREEKKKLVKDGVLKKKDLIETPVEEDEQPFKIPESWVWCRHNYLFSISGGSQPPKSLFSSLKKDGYIRLYQIRDYGKSPQPVYIPISKASKITQKGDILLARYGASLGKVFYAEEGAYNVAMAKVEYMFNKGTIDHNFLFLYYHGRLYQDLLNSISNRSAQGGFNKEDLNKLLVPLPPLAEQHRIVQKIEELYAEIDNMTINNTNINEVKETGSKE